VDQADLTTHQSALVQYCREKSVVMKYLTIFAAALLPCVAAHAEEAPPREVGVESSVSFPAFGGIRNFRADDDRGVWLEDRQRKWYYAGFLGTCPEIRHAQAIGLETRGSARFDRFSKIIVGHDVCAIATLVSADKPLSLREQRRFKKQAQEALKAQPAN